MVQKLTNIIIDRTSLERLLRGYTLNEIYDKDKNSLSKAMDAISEMDCDSIICFFYDNTGYKFPLYLYKNVQGAISFFDLPLSSYKKEVQLSFDKKIVRVSDNDFFILTSDNPFFNHTGKVASFLNKIKTRKDGKIVVIDEDEYGQRFELPLQFNVYERIQHMNDISGNRGVGKYSKY